MNILDRMRAEWNDRARKDAHFYAAFGRQDQADEDFLAGAAETMPMFEREFQRLPPGPVSQRRALEIGCGPGRFMIPMSRHFGEVHGVDVSDHMASLARHRLREVPHAQVHVTSGADLGIFEDAWFDFVYSYIVFQHIPSREIVLNYLREARRVLKPGGVLCCQVRGAAPLASEMSRESETWTGCYFNAAEIAQFAREESFPLVALSLLDTQYMWITLRQPLSKAALAGTATGSAPERVVLKGVTAANGPEPRIPARGRDAAVSLWIDGMPGNASLADCAVRFGDLEQSGCYLSPISDSGGCQLDARLPDGVAPGEYEVQLTVCGQPALNAHGVTVLEPEPWKPRVLSVTDGINLTSKYRMETGGGKVVIEDVARPREVLLAVAGRPVEYLQYECKDPITSTYEFAFHLARRTPRGRHQILSVRVDGRELGPIDLEVA